MYNQTKYYYYYYLAHLYSTPIHALSSFPFPSSLGRKTLPVKDAHTYRTFYLQKLTRQTVYLRLGTDYYDQRLIPA